ncbi:YifB family Mg chelatase-like AAA ATPase [Nocardioides sp.]|uniref:YifB family Mg chelatase-like AAA ATPase n=1 Tax=Nocardioides sp. TaxID=35761 RepID=UPI0035153027
MSTATARTVSLHGAIGHVVDVQVDVSPGQVGLTMVGRPDLSLRESGDRCRMAVLNSDLPWPVTKRTTILLSPADLLKRGPHFDLAVALAVLAAQQHLPPQVLPDLAVMGELTLDGRLRCVPGVLPMALAAAARGLRGVIVPEPQVPEAVLVPGLEVVGVRSLAQAVALLRGQEVPEAPAVEPPSVSRVLAWRGEQRLDDLDLADLRGMADAKFAAEVAAAGGHPLLLTGPKGGGKTSIAERLPSLLPDLSPEEALELTAVHSLAGTLPPGHGLMTRPPFSAPHHDASKASIVGGGSRQVRPGELSRTHAGVLFLDEFPLFRTDIIEALREPLENGDITIARTEESVTLPARGLLVLAANPCPCGDHDPVSGRSTCTCRATALRDYQNKLHGPVADRIDLRRHVGPLSRHEGDPLRDPDTSAVVRARVAAARERQAARYAGCGWRLNAHAPSTALRDRWPLAGSAAALLEETVYTGRLSSRGAVRVHRVAWTLADLEAVRTGRDVVPGPRELDLALSLRCGDPLPASLWERCG